MWEQIITDFVGPCKLFFILSEMGSDFADFEPRHDIFHIAKKSDCCALNKLQVEE